MMFENKTKVLLIVAQDVLDRARGLAGEATTTLKLPVSMQIVLRALIEEGLNRDGDRKLFANIEGQARAVRRIRSLARRKEDPNGNRGASRVGDRERHERTGRSAAPDMRIARVKSQ